MSAISQPASPQPLTVPAEFLRDLLPAGSSSSFLRPTDIHVDANSGEIFVTEAGGNRILIFNADGMLRYQFSCGDVMTHPSCLDVDADGYIYVLGPSVEGRGIYRYDYDGLALSSLPLPSEIAGTPLDLSSIALDDSGRLFALDRGGKRVCIFDLEGSLLDTFDVAPQLDEDLRSELSFGSLHVHGDRLYLPMPGLGVVQIYDFNGNHLRSLGRKGSTMGEMSFPIAVAHAAGDMLLVLDKHRFNVLGFDGRGRFLGEFGGKGLRSGWFYHPSLLAVDEKDQVYVGQLFENKIQICRIPAFMTMSSTIKISALGERSSIADPLPTRGTYHNAEFHHRDLTAEEVQSHMTFASSFGG
ncbi:NHL repeat-containing protein [bacterium]|nr:NHL repeat-containing protein [bacterium]